MVETNHIRSLLEEKRRDLADQLNAVDRAIAALNGAADVTTEHPASAEVHLLVADLLWILWVLLGAEVIGARAGYGAREVEPA